MLSSGLFIGWLAPASGKHLAYILCSNLLSCVEQLFRGTSKFFNKRIRLLSSLNAFIRYDFYYLLANNSFRLTTKLDTSFNFILTRKPTCFEKINAYIGPLQLVRTDSIAFNFRIAYSSKRFSFLILPWNLACPVHIKQGGHYKNYQTFA